MQFFVFHPIHGVQCTMAMVMTMTIAMAMNIVLIRFIQWHKLYKTCQHILSIVFSIFFRCFCVVVVVFRFQSLRVVCFFFLFKFIVPFSFTMFLSLLIGLSVSLHMNSTYWFVWFSPSPCLLLSRSGWI